MVKKKMDDIDPVPTALRRKVKLITDGPFLGYQQAILDDLRLKMEPYERIHKQILEATRPSEELMKSMSQVIAANEKAIDLFRLSMPQTAWQVEIEKIHKSWADQFAPLKSMIEEMKTAASFDFSSIAKSLTASESIASAIGALASPPDFGLSATAIEYLRAEERRMAQSMRSLIDSVAIPRDYLTLPYSSILGASREVFTNSNAIGSLYPTVGEDSSVDLIEEERRAREETSDCVELIKIVDPDLVLMYQGSLDALKSDSTDKPRHVLVSLRELWTHVLHRLAPDNEVMGWIDPNDKSLLHEGKPTRRARALYICRNVRQGDLARFVECDTKSIVALFDVFQDVHKVDPQLTDGQLKALALRSESYITYIIQVWRETQ